jgi:hypothetical protein
MAGLFFSSAFLTFSKAQLSGLVAASQLLALLSRARCVCWWRYAARLSHTQNFLLLT